jgi:hypothetical protein
MKHIKKMYEEALAANGDSPKSVMWPKGRQDMRFSVLANNITNKKNFSVLDFGCGLAHLREYLDANYTNVKYTGVDIVSQFLELNKKKHPNDTFVLINDVEDIKGSYDYVFVSGTFNIKYNADDKKNREIIFSGLKELFKRTNIYLSANFMTDVVDYRQPDTYHQNVMDLYQFAVNNLSRRIVIDQSYMPYEYTITIWKDQSIIRPENIYSNV